MSIVYKYGVEAEVWMCRMEAGTDDGEDARSREERKAASLYRQTDSSSATAQTHVDAGVVILFAVLHSHRKAGPWHAAWQQLTAPFAMHPGFLFVAAQGLPLASSLGVRQDEPRSRL